jgi:aspartyl-tRNA(Asn)/glutamyl-tRNA(Gln) amidotransferase subunit C
MNRMLSFIDKLNELDTSQVEPLVYMTQETAPLREDTPAVTISQKEALKNAPRKDSDYFKVPKVIDQNEH